MKIQPKNLRSGCLDNNGVNNMKKVIILTLLILSACILSACSKNENTEKYIYETTAYQYINDPNHKELQTKCEDKEQIEIALLYAQPELEQEGAAEEADRICAGFFEQLPEVQQRLLKDVEAGFDGDPAAKSKEEIISSYPGLFAIYVYRLAHLLYKEEVPYIPRIMTEYAHGKTGIDINPGATIGDYFFIDHGTGVVIGETTEIGRNVKLYQGVTLGALSTRQGQQLANVKRHPTIRDNVTIYSNASVLGGETVVGENTIIGGNTFITESVPANTKVSAKSPELVIKKSRSAVSKTDVWDWQD